MQNKTLQQFYNDYAAWLDAGAPEGQPFVRSQGLCINLWDWSEHNVNLDIELSNQFKDAGLDEDYPFNVNGNDHHRETDSELMHLNPLRIKWVKDHANNQ